MSAYVGALVQIHRGWSVDGGLAITVVATETVHHTSTFVDRALHAQCDFPLVTSTIFEEIACGHWATVLITLSVANRTAILIMEQCVVVAPFCCCRTEDRNTNSNSHHDL